MFWIGKRNKRAAALLFLCALLSGCAVLPGVVLGTTAVVGITAAQERPFGQAINDATIRLGLDDRIMKKSEVLFGRIGTRVIEGRVLLMGNVASAEEQAELTQIARSIEGVREVLNETQINDHATEYVQDTWIPTRLRALLIADRDVMSVNYTIDAWNGNVYLMGIAQEDAELRRVIEYARTIRGVRKVVSHVIMRDSPVRRSDLPPKTDG